MKKKRAYYDVVCDYGNKVLKETNTLTRAREFMKQYLKKHPIDADAVGINRMYYENGRLYAYEIC